MAPADRLQTLLDLSHRVSSSLDLTEVLEEFTARAAELANATAAELSLWDRDREAVVMLVERVSGHNEVTEVGGELYLLSDYPATRTVLETQEPVQIQISNENHDPSERAFLERRGLRSLLMVPLVARGETIGLMEVIDERERIFDAYDVDFCRALCDVVAVAVRNAMLYSQVQEMAVRDALTGLYNRRLYHDLFRSAIARSGRTGEDIAFLVVDLDGLKRVNDRGGHEEGDEALRLLAQAIRETVRADDVGFRLGGDEFAVLLPGASGFAAMRVADRLQSALLAAGNGRYTFSGGVACMSTCGTDPDDIYRAADHAAFRAKAAGGARTLIAVEPAESQLATGA